MENKEEHVISKIRLENVTYEVKDEEARDILDILLGNKKEADENKETASNN